MTNLLSYAALAFAALVTAYFFVYVPLQGLEFAIAKGLLP